SGHGNFSTVQGAIDAVPADNTRWIRVQISPGVYTEKVLIPLNKPCIFLEGAGYQSTRIEFDDHENKIDSPIFISRPDNIVAKGITFKNTFGYPDGGIKAKRNEVKPATAFQVDGDKCAFFECAFIGMQDTLYDHRGRHHFRDCYIEGATDFIYGYGQSIYENCTISINIGKLAPPVVSGFITAQSKATPQETNGFVFKSCEVTGVGKAKLGRAWKAYSTVIFYKTDMKDVIDPEGWFSWHYAGHEKNFTYVEVENTGPGADTSKRVKWMKQLSGPQLEKYSGHGKYSTVQSAINAISDNNTRWIRVQILPGVYTEKVVIPANKPCIFLEGAGYQSTRIEFDDGQVKADSPIFISHPDNIVAKGITFKNTFNYRDSGIKAENIEFRQATAFQVEGDKCAFFQCAFVGIQDTLFDKSGRHYFKDNYIEGCVDFIYGSGQSIYEHCTIFINIGKFAPTLSGFITAQSKSTPQETNGFVFKSCNITGKGFHICGGTEYGNRGNRSAC
ncbi:hypothetical protein Tsubulata_046277, partial [Turnera subulata]